ncbi:MAG TPA: circularly permuted type 2 ATP-grasp protein, partial [Sorangium sp.]|nr:circularly permuted type 2 ATP-grasp protein [Sorangium sp.]
GMLMGPQSTAAQRDEFRARIEATPRRYIAQHRVELSTSPTWDPAVKAAVPRRLDLRPYVLTGRDGSWALPGGLTRVALVAGSYVVNSSQGGGSKDTWVLKGPSDGGQRIPSIGAGAPPPGAANNTPSSAPPPSEPPEAL